MKKPKLFNPRPSSPGKQFNGKAAIDAMYASDEWKSFRLRFLKINPKCYCCGNPATVTDHIKAWKSDIKLFEKEDNMLPLCARCHNVATATFDRFPVQKYNDKLNWLARCREKNWITVKVFVIPYRDR